MRHRRVLPDFLQGFYKAWILLFSDTAGKADFGIRDGSEDRKGVT